MKPFLKTSGTDTAFESSIQLYSMEINFLLKILTSEYRTFTSIEKIKKLDSFWKSFEKFAKRLKDLDDEKKQFDLDISVMNSAIVQNSSLQTSKEKYFMVELSYALYELQILKNKVYSYLEHSSEQ